MIAPPVAPRACLHTLRSVPLADSCLASPLSVALSPLLLFAVSSEAPRDLRALLHHQVRCRHAVFPQELARCFLGLCSSSRCSLHPECSNEHLRGSAAVTVLPLNASNMCLRPECAASLSWAARQAMPAHPSRCHPKMPSTTTQCDALPAGLPTCASLPLRCSSRPFVHFRAGTKPIPVESCSGGAVLQRPAREKVALFLVSPNLSRCLKGNPPRSHARPSLLSVHRNAC